MNDLRLAFCFLGILSLSACANTLAGLKADNAREQRYRSPSTTFSGTWKGMKADSQDASDWAHNRPSSLEATLGGPAPTGYAGQNTTAILLPATAAAKADHGALWRDIDQLGAWHSPPPARKSAAPQWLLSQRTAGRPIEYNDDVSVFPVDGDAAPYASAHAGSF